MVLFIGQETNPLAAVPANGAFASTMADTACSTGSLDGRRKFFAGAEGGILEVIDRAIDVAAADRPRGLWSKQPRLTSLRHPLRPPHPAGCERIDLGGSAEADGSCSAKKAAEGRQKDVAERSDKGACKLSAGIFTEESRDERRIMEEVMAAKAVLEVAHNELDIFVYELLRQLMKIQLSYEILQETKIGFAVRAFRHRKSKKIRSLVRNLILKWRTVVDKWVESTDASEVQNNDQPDLVKKKPKIQSLVQDASTKKLPISQNEGKDKNSKKLKDLPRLPPLHRKPMLPPTEKSICTEEDSFKAKIEIAKRKFHELYGENGKRQRMK